MAVSSSSMATDLTSLLQMNSPTQRISFSVRVRSCALPSSCGDNMGQPWVHCDVLPSAALSETLDYRYRPYSVAYSPVWRYRSHMWLDKPFEQVRSDDAVECTATTGVIDSVEDVYFPVDIPAIASLDLIGCLYCVVSVTAGHAPVATANLVNSQADDDVCGEDDRLHKRVPRFAAWEPLWTIRVAEVAKFELLSTSVDNRFSKTTIVPPVSSAAVKKPINVIRFEMASARRFDPSQIRFMKLFDNTLIAQPYCHQPPAPKRARLSLRQSVRQQQQQQQSSADDASTSAITHVQLVNGKSKRLHATVATDEQANETAFRLDMLPPEIIIQIVDSTPGGSAFSKLKMLTVLSGVCRRLRAIASDSSLYSVVDLKPIGGSSHRLSASFINFITNRCNRSLRFLRLSWIPSLSKGIRLDKMVTSGCLSTVILQSCPLVDDDFLKQLCKYNTNIETVDLSYCWGIGRRGFGCLDALRNLKRLALAHTLVCQKTLDMLLISCSKLEVLNLSSLDVSNMDAVCTTIGQHAKQLISLDLSENHSLSPSGLNKIADGCSLLQELVLLQSSLLTSIAACHSASLSWKELRRLVLHVADVGALEMLATEKENLTYLEQLVVSCFRRNGAPIAVLHHLLAAFPNLFYLKVPIEWPSAADFEESRLQLANLRRNYPKCTIQTH